MKIYLLELIGCWNSLDRFLQTCQALISENIFKIIFCVFIIIGSSVSLGSVLNLSDSMIFLMSVANLVGVYFLASVVRSEVNKYLSDLSEGKIKRTDNN